MKIIKKPVKKTFSSVREPVIRKRFARKNFSLTDDVLSIVKKIKDADISMLEDDDAFLKIENIDEGTAQQLSDLLEEAGFEENEDFETVEYDDPNYDMTDEDYDNDDFEMPQVWGVYGTSEAIAAELLADKDWEIEKMQPFEDGVSIRIGCKDIDISLWIDVRKEDDETSWDWNKYIFYGTQRDRLESALQENENMWYVADSLVNEVDFSRKRKFSKKFSNRRNFAKSDVAFGKQLADYYGLVTFEPKFEGIKVIITEESYTI